MVVGRAHGWRMVKQRERGRERKEGREATLWLYELILTLHFEEKKIADYFVPAKMNV